MASLPLVVLQVPRHCSSSLLTLSPCAQQHKNSCGVGCPSFVGHLSRPEMVHFSHLVISPDLSCCKYAFLCLDCLPMCSIVCVHACFLPPLPCNCGHFKVEWLHVVHNYSTCDFRWREAFSLRGAHTSTTKICHQKTPRPKGNVGQSVFGAYGWSQSQRTFVLH